jgi:hypothetical protein
MRTFIPAAVRVSQERKTMRFRFTHHAIMEMARRGISEDEVTHPLK